MSLSASFLAMLPLVCFAQERRPSYDPTGQAQSSKPKDGFVDFALKSINPADKDYGQCLDEGRKMLLEETVRNGYFWSNLVALGLLACLFVIIVYQHRVQTCREWAAAETLAQYEHSLSRANAQVEEATNRNRGLMEALTALREFRAPFPIATWRGAGPSRCRDRQQPNIQHTGQPSSDNQEQRYQIGARPFREGSDRNTTSQSDRTVQAGRGPDHEGQFAGATVWPVPG